MTGTLPVLDDRATSLAGAEPIESPGAARLKSLTEVLAETDDKLRQGHAAGARVWPTGFEALDVALSGGFRSG